ncbi:MAG: hypothetical protein U0835_01720 [Isosphaeraceae bacterium]
MRLFLPTFVFLAAFAGWGAVWAADGLTRLFRACRAWPARAFAAALVLVPSTYQLVKVHPFELSYYNELVGGPRGAWGSGNFELTYWYDAFNRQTLEELNAKFPPGAEVEFLNDKTNPMTFVELQSLGELRGDITLGARDKGRFPHVWLLAQDSKASTFTRLLYGMTPWYARTPPQLDGLRVATVADPTAVSRAWALWLLVDAPDESPSAPAPVPELIRQYAPFLGRFWGEGLKKIRRLTPNEPVFAWARSDPESLRAAARHLASGKDPNGDPNALRLFQVVNRYPPNNPGYFWNVLRKARPQALVEAVEILVRHPDAVRTVQTRYSYTDPATVGGCLDRDLEGTRAPQ